VLIRDSFITAELRPAFAARACFGAGNTERSFVSFVLLRGANFPDNRPALRNNEDFGYAHAYQ